MPVFYSPLCCPSIYLQFHLLTHGKSALHGVLSVILYVGRRLRLLKANCLQPVALSVEKLHRRAYAWDQMIGEQWMHGLEV